MTKFYNVRIGVHPICWTNDDMHDLGDFISFDRMLDEVKMAGYSGTELGRKYPRDPKVLKKAMADRDLVLTSGWCDTLYIDKNYADKYLEGLKKHADFLCQMGCKSVIACEGGKSVHWDPREDRTNKGPENATDDEWKLFGEYLNKAGEYCRSLRMTLAYHVHTGTIVSTMEDTERLCSETDADKVSILADTGHLRYCGVDIPAFFKKFAARINYVHLKDIREDVLKQVYKFSMDFNSSVRVGVFTVPGDGCINFNDVFEILSANGYQGWMVVEAEQNALHANPLRYVSMAREYIKKSTGC